jgi:hypothetical protein
MATLPLPIASYELASPVGSSARLVNCHASPAPQGGKSATILTRAPGITTLATIGSSGGRGAIKMNGVLYALYGTTLYKITSAWASSSVGTIPGSDRVRMATNGTNIVIVRPSAGTGYYCDGATTTQIVDAVFTGFGAADVAFVHRYYVFRRPNTGQFFASQLNESLFNDFDALDIAEAEQVADDLVALTVDHEEVLLFGTDSSEIWYDAANDSGLPFSKSPGGLVALGIAGSEAHGQQDNSTFWVANERTIRRLTGATPQKVSQEGIDTQLQRMTQVSDCYTVSYTVDGHMMIAFIFSFDDRTLVYDCTVQQWHERESFGLGAWRPAEIVDCYGKQLVIDTESGKLGYLDATAMTEFDEAQRMSWTFQAVYAENRLALHRSLEIVVNVGHGLLSGQGSDPLITLEVSDDGGNTFRTLPTKSLGLRGNYSARVKWDQLGSSTQRVYRMSITDPVPVMTVAAVLIADGARF